MNILLSSSYTCHNLQYFDVSFVFLFVFVLIRRGVIMGPPVQQNKLCNPRKQNVPLRMNPSSNPGTSNNSSGAPSPNNNLSWANLNGMKQK